jgi:hypothetical protein
MSIPVVLFRNYYVNHSNHSPDFFRLLPLDTYEPFIYFIIMRED